MSRATAQLACPAGGPAGVAGAFFFLPALLAA